MGIVPVIVWCVGVTKLLGSALLAVGASSLGAVIVAVIVAGCGAGANGATGFDSVSGDSTSLDVVASFYPLQFVAERVGGDAVTVGNITPAGAEPHDFELTARDAGRLEDADLVVYPAGLAPSIDDGIDAVGATALDISTVANLDLHRDSIDAASGEALSGHDESDIDPHFWLDPLRLADVGDTVAARLAELAPSEAATFEQNAARLRAELEQLDQEFTDALADCASTDLVTSHEAFGYLAQRYRLTQVGITGLSPDSEPSPARLAEVADFVADNDVQTIFFETLVDPSIAETVADETGASTAVLDPLEGLTDQSAGADYLAVMRANLASLRSGLGCS
jgi:zinc transport system substrate-binding protein